MSTTFVGRRDELALLEAACSEAAAQQRPAAVVIVGRPGSGKSRLLAELRRKQGPRVLTLAGYETGTRVPLAAAAGLLHTLGQSSEAGSALTELLSRPLSTEERSLEPLRIFEAGRRGLLGLDGLILLLVDDLQWVDDLSLALCSYLVRAAESESIPLAVVAASRPGAEPMLFRDALSKEFGLDRVRTFELGPLPREDGLQLISQLAPGASRERVEDLWQRAQGSPFWLGILARSAQGEDLAGYLAVQQAGLGGDATRLLALLAIATHPLTFSECAGAMDWDDVRVERAIFEVERSGLVTRRGESPVIAHDLIRESVIAQLPATRRRQLHAALARWLEQQADADAQLLHEALVHRREAGMDVTDLALRVLQSSRRRLIARDGLGELVRIADSASTAEPVAVALGLSVAALASELGEQQLAMDRWSSLASSVRDPLLRATAYLAASRAALHIVERRAEAFPLLELAEGQDTDDPVLAVEIESHRANLLQVMKGRAEEGRQAAFHAADTARRHWGGPPVEFTSRERDAYVTALQVAFDSAVIEEDGAAQLGITEQLAQVARGSEEGPIWADHDRATALMFFGRTSEALVAARRAWDQARERTLPTLMLTSGSNLASKLLDVGRPEEAEEVISECLELERRAAGSGERFGMAKVGNWSIHSLRHEAWLTRGDWRDAIASLEREVTTQQEPHYRMHLHWHIFVWLARCGDRTAAKEVDRHVEASRRDAQVAGCRRCSRELRLKSAEAFVRLGRADDAEAELHAWEEAGRAAHFTDSLWRQHVAALIALARDDPSGIQELEAVREERKRHGLMSSMLWARLDLAAALAPADSSRAAAEFREAGEAAAAIGAGTEQQMAEFGLRRLGVRTWKRGKAPRGQSALAMLSEREKQMANLIAAGNSNPEIASRLFLSRKTVERHVSNILARTGARNRTDLARLLAEK